jgi:dTDP-4-dehydrorhamnose reductase
MKIAIIGAGGRLGAALVREFQNKYQVTGFDRSQLDLTNLDDLHEKLRATDFDVLINAAAFTNVDRCETERDLAFLINGEAPGLLSAICRERAAKLIHFSTDYVFDGSKRAPYTEEDEATPISAYGASKLAGEKNVLAANAEHLVVRVSWVFGPDRPSFVDAMIKRAQETEKVDAVADKFSTPTYTLDIAEMVGHLLDGSSRRAHAPNGLGAGRLKGVLHFANAGECTWREYAQWALECCDKIGLSLKARTVGASKLKDMTNWIARRPVYSVLSTARYAQLTGTAPRAWREAVGDYITRFYSQR